MNITENRFLELIKKCHLIIKKVEGIEFNLENYWGKDNLSPLMAMFFRYKDKNRDREEYVKVYFNKKERNVDVYLYARGEICGVTASGKQERRDLLIKSCVTYEDFEKYLKNIILEIGGEKDEN